MPTAAENLITARDGYAAKLAAIASDTDHHVTYTDQGRSFSWTEYQAFLLKQIDDINKSIQALSGPVMIRRRTRAY